MRVAVAHSQATHADGKSFGVAWRGTLNRLHVFRSNSRGGTW